MIKKKQQEIIELINKSSKKCEYCGSTFTANNLIEKYCCDICRKLARHDIEKDRVSSGIPRLLKNRRQYYHNNGMKKELDFFNNRVNEFKLKIKTGECSEEDLTNWIMSTYKYSVKKQ